MNTIIYVALCCAAISFTITTTSMFTWLRELVSKIHPKMEELIHCPWCLNHYVVLVCLFFTNFGVLNSSISPIFNFIFTWFVIVCMGGIIHYVLLRAYEPVAKAMMNRKLDKLKMKNKQHDIN